jgi:lipopolysaccharide export system protein LptA
MINKKPFFNFTRKPGAWPLHLVLGLLLIFPALHSAAQNPARDSIGKLRIESSETGEAFLSAGRELRKLSGTVRLRQDSTYIACDTAIIDGNNAILIGNVLIEQGDSVKIFSDSARYFGNERTCDLYSQVVLVNRGKELFTEELNYDLNTKLATYHKGARLNNGQSQLTSQHGYYFVDDKKIFFKGDVLITDQDFTVRTDTMGFDTEGQIAEFYAPTLISQRDARVYCEGGYYDIQKDYAEFNVNPQYEKEGQRGRAQILKYTGLTNEYILEGDAVVEEAEAERITKADIIRYNIDEETAVLTGNAYYKDSTQEASGEKIRYESRTKRFQLLGRGRVSDPPNIIEADSIDFNDELGNGLALGNVILRDTSANFSIHTWRLDYNKQNSFLNAFGGFGDSEAEGRPLFKTLIEGDTLYMSADTLSSFETDTLGEFRLLLAYKDVRIFKSNLQAVCDSLSFSTTDSIFRFYQLSQLPIIWSDTSQFSADTIFMGMKNSQVDRIWLRKNALVINSEDKVYFNQIKGKNNTALFRENELREMLVEGNAQAIYYALDDDRAYIGMNETTCAEMRLYFGNNKVDNIRFYAQPTGKFTPMAKIREGTKLEGFFWETKRRPRRIQDLF